MYYYYYYYYGFSKKYDFKDYIVRIEEVNRKERTILLDFYDSFQHRKFFSQLDVNKNIEGPSMLLIKNIDFQNSKIMEDGIYILKDSFFIDYKSQIMNQDSNSFLIGYTIDFENQSINKFLNSNSYIYYNERIKFENKVTIESNYLDLNYNINNSESLKVIVRDVGQANWNEIKNDEITKIVYDIGLPTNYSNDAVCQEINRKVAEYLKCKPILILSHWDKDHYHGLLGMTDDELKCFSAFVCRDDIPNNTCQVLFDRICYAIGYSNVYPISYINRIPDTPRGYKCLSTDQIGDFKIYNAEKSYGRNRSGIVLSLKNGKSSIVLSGDSHYRDISRFVLQDLDNVDSINHLVVPHHGGNAGRYEYELINAIKERAIISYGVNSHGHPNTCNVNELTTNFISVESTHIVNNDIEINLV